MGSARARQSQHPGRSAPPGDEGHPESPHQAPRNLSPVCAFDHWKKPTGEFFEQDASFAVHDLRLPRAPGKARRDSRAHARGRHRAAANRQPHGESALLEALARIRRSHRRARRPEHLVQRQRADRLPPGRGARLFPPDADGRSGDRQFRPREESLHPPFARSPPSALPGATN